jgi:hypothetical protein
MDNQTAQYAQQNLTLPHDVVPLPTGGVFYKNKKSSVKVGYLTANDENIIMGGGDNLTYNLVRAKLFEPDIKPEDLMESDIEAIMIFLRNTSFGPEITMNVIDPKTNKSFEANIGLGELSIKKGIDPNDEGLFETVLPVSKRNVKLRPLTLGDTMEIQNMASKYPTGRTVPRITWRLEKQIIELDGSRDRGAISTFVNQMLIGDSKYIRKFLDDNEPRLDMERVVMTPSGDKLTVLVGFGVDFFRPFF